MLRKQKGNSSISLHSKFQTASLCCGDKRGKGGRGNITRERACTLAPKVVTSSVSLQTTVHPPSWRAPRGSPPSAWAAAARHSHVVSQTEGEQKQTKNCLVHCGAHVCFGGGFRIRTYIYFYFPMYVDKWAKEGTQCTASDNGFAKHQIPFPIPFTPTKKSCCVSQAASGWSATTTGSRASTARRNRAGTNFIT